MKRIMFYFDLIGFEDDKKFALRQCNDKEWIIEKEIFFTDNTDFLKKAYSYDLIVFDYGGFQIGVPTLIEDIRRDFINAIKENPNTQFISVSNMPDYFLKDELGEIDIEIKVGWKYVFNFMIDQKWIKVEEEYLL